MSAALTESPAITPPAEGIGHVVLGRTPRGDVEVERALFPLNPAQRELLLLLDGRRSLRQLVAAQPKLQSARLARDAARLLAFGLVKQLRGELPRDVVVSSMNLTMKLPAEAFRHLAQAEQKAPAAPAGSQPAAAEPERSSWPWISLGVGGVAVLLVVVAALR
jgi:hypothetical protein